MSLRVILRLFAATAAGTVAVPYLARNFSLVSVHVMLGFLLKLVANTATLRIFVATSTASTWVVAKSATAYATTTQLKSFSVGSANLASLVVNATTTDTEVATVFAPNTFLVWSNNVQPGDPTKFNGFCQAEFVAI